MIKDQNCSQGRVGLFKSKWTTLRVLLLAARVSQAVYMIEKCDMNAGLSVYTSESGISSVSGVKDLECAIFESMQGRQFHVG